MLRIPTKEKKIIKRPKIPTTLYIISYNIITGTVKVSSVSTFQFLTDGAKMFIGHF